MFKSGNFFAKTHILTMLLSFFSFFVTSIAYELIPEEFDTYHKERHAIYLNGDWDMIKIPGTEKNQPDDPGMRQGFFNTEFQPGKEWRQTSVPGSWNIDYAKWLRWNEGEKDFCETFTGVGWLRKKFFVPENFKGQRLILHFDYVDSEALVWLNGKVATYHKNMRDWFHKQLDESFEIDVTENIHFGTENTLAVRVYDNGGPEMQYKKLGAPAGMRGAVWLEAKPDIYVKKMFINPRMPESEIEVDYILENTSGIEKNIRMDVTAAPVGRIKGRSSYNIRTDEIKAPAGESKHCFMLSMPDSALWSIWEPNLYMLRIKQSDADEKAPLMGFQRFGIREFKTKGRKFFLNDKEIFWTGTTFTPAEIGHSYPFLWYNHRNWLRKVLSAYKEMNLNRIRVHSSKYPSILYDLCDELGLMVTDEYMGPPLRMLKQEEIKHVAEIAAYNEKSSAKLSADREKELLSQIESAYNHPSVVTWSCGNERHDKGAVSIVETLAAEYRFYKKIDRQNRPVCGSGGRFMEREKTLTDYFDDHAYNGSGFGGRCMTAIPEHIREYFKKIKALYGNEPNIPYVNGEGFYYNYRWGITLKAMKVIFPDGKPDIGKYLDVLIKNPSSVIRMFGIPLLNRIGIHQYADEAKYHQWVARFLKRYIEMYRRLKEFHVSGVELLQDFLLITLPIKGDPEAYMRALPEFKSLHTAASPLLACFDFFNQNVFAGRKFETVLWTINDTPENLDSLELEALLLDVSGKELAHHKMIVGYVEQGGIAKQKFEMDLDPKLASGFYTIKLELADKKKKILSENTYEIFVLSKNDAYVKISSEYSVGFYDKSRRLEKIFNDAGVSCKKMEEFNSSADFDIIFIGPESVDDKVQSSNLSAFFERGGKLFVLEQNPMPSVPWLPNVRTRQVWPDTFVDILRPEHPVFDKLTQKNWDIWSWPKDKPGNLGRIFDVCILPVDASVLAAGAIQGWNSNQTGIGSVIIEVPLGKGTVFMSQAQAVFRYDDDSAARRYILNILKYAMPEKNSKAGE